jgi:arsenate reductase
VCIGNAGRSQMAQAVNERPGGDARSAGSRPEPVLHPQVVESMKEIGIELSDRRPKGITQEHAERADVVVLMGCGDACPVIPGKHYVDWNLADPVAMSVAEVRELRAEIEEKIAAL